MTPCLICDGTGRLPYRDGSGVYFCAPCRGTGHREVSRDPESEARDASRSEAIKAAADYLRGHHDPEHECDWIAEEMIDRYERALGTVGAESDPTPRGQSAS